MDYSLVDYTLVPCTFCGAARFQDCIKVRGRRKGQRADQHHAQRAYAYWAATRKPLVS